MYSDAVEMLTSLGLSVAADDPMLRICYEAAAERLRNYTNQTVVPDGLQMSIVYLVVAEYLKYAKGVNKLVDAVGNPIIDYSAVAKSVSEGDTSVTYAVGSKEGASTPEQRLDAFIDQLTAHVAHEAIKYRKLVW